MKCHCIVVESRCCYIALFILCFLVVGCAARAPLKVRLEYTAGRSEGDGKAREPGTHPKRIGVLNVTDERSEKSLLGHTDEAVLCDNVTEWVERGFGVYRNGARGVATRAEEAREDKEIGLDVHIKKVDCHCGNLNMRCSVYLSVDYRCSSEVVWSQQYYGTKTDTRGVWSRGYCHFNAERIGECFNGALDQVFLKIADDLEERRTSLDCAGK